MIFEPINKFWIAPTPAELAAANARLKSALLAVSVAAVIGWLLFLWRIAK